ncbi:radical SAM protein [Sulfuricella denitrificans skB26]|uniref:Radical SAM protein n=1 Tax=Sulfuricella denitrificans (strain DSM 22764 / NBRC 105220 / skB26) TaxID=1163617 RepID=S6ABF0_SULDS|nr:radical SAM protein [Sulfuricella denitrificans]BAN34643.1 radical SAM protein [Sulfuricella denitrificans skB26]
MDWLNIAAKIEPLEGLSLDAALVGEMQCAADTMDDSIDFYTPSFKSYATSEIASCSKSAWPAVSITGPDCKLQCDHCKGRVLASMIPARTPEELWRVANQQIEHGARGMLLTGGSNHHNEVEYDPYYATIRHIKEVFPEFRIALHTALVDRDMALRMEDSGIDAAMMDVIGAQETITQVYHLKRSVDDFERSLENLVATRLKVVPHIVLGLHYGHLLGERVALEMLRRHQPAAVVLVVVMPFYAPAHQPFGVPDSLEVGRFFLDARQALPDIPLLLGCARPAGQVKAEIDAYALMAGLNGIAHPADGMVELAARLGRKARIASACCSMAVGGEMVMGGGVWTKLGASSIPA